MNAYDSEDCELMAKALDQAWDIFLRTRGLTSENIDTARASLAYALLEAIANGERNPRRLAFSAVARMPVFEPAVRRDRSHQLGRIAKAS